MGQEKILIVEDESTFALFLKVSLARLGYAITGIADTGHGAFDLAVGNSPDVILMDINIKGDIDGIEAAKKIIAAIDVPIVFLTAHSDSATLKKAKTVTPYGYLVKPFEERSLQTTIATAIYKHRIEKKLRREELNFRNLVETASDGLVISDESGEHLFSNGKATEITGYTARELREIRVENLAETPLDKKCITEVSLSGSCSATILSKNKDRIHIEVTGVETWWNDRPALMLFIRDCSELRKVEEEKRKLESQLAQAEKLKTVGTLAGGVAHTINNILMAIQGNASLMSHELDNSSPHRKYLETIEKYTKDGASITEQLLGFARGGKYEIQQINVNNLVTTSAEMYGNSNKAIEINVTVQTEPLAIEGDKGQIEQVLLNLYLNAGQAMPNGGRLYLKTTGVELDSQTCQPHQAEPGGFVKITVTDTGVGMDESTRQQLFEPFYTTRKVGNGIGLGLASVYGIVRNHHGFINVQSEVGQGTTFDIYLPAAEALTVQNEEENSVAVLRSRKTILFVDDEEMILEVGRGLLEHLGYRVITAESGERAVEYVLKKGKEIDLVILDMIMPGMDGGETFDRIQEIDRSLAIMLSSGYSLEGKAREILQRGCKDFIKKPFTLLELSDKLNKIFHSTKG